MITRLIRIQLTIFAFVSLISVVVMSLVYLRLPNAFGIGTYRVTVDLAATGGLYQKANVAYRGVTIGTIDSIDLSANGVIAAMKLNSKSHVPQNVTATVKSVSAIGEQYLDLVPPGKPSTSMLREGSTIPRDRTAISQDVAGLLTQAESLVSSVRDSRLQDLLREAFKAFNGSGPELSQLIRSAREFVDTAQAAVGPTTQLIDDVGPLLDSQIRSGDNIKTLAKSLAQLTTQVKAADPQVRTLLATAPGATDEASTAFAGIRPSFPVLAANMANLGRIGTIYHKSIEQLLVVLPALFGAVITVANGEVPDEGGKLDFKLSIGDPPPCSVGFLPPTAVRSSADTTLRDVPKDMYCKVAQSDPSVVRGARNYPCMEYPGKRAPTVELCRDPRGYVPIGTNPWRGPPVPYGTPVINPRNILPPNKFPNIPPEADYDPGPPVVQLPPGVPPGPGPAPNAPFPLPVPPANGPPPPPWPYHGPTVPPYALPPDTPPPVAPSAAESPGLAMQPDGATHHAQSYATYDRNGTFVDPSGGTGVFAAGDVRRPPPETWLDLMTDPRPE